MHVIRPESLPYRGMDRSSRPDAEMEQSGTTTSGSRTTRCKNSRGTMPRFVGWLGGQMDNFWLPEGMIILSIVGSESELFDGSRGGAHDADE